jgi:predicted aldo/keto reductase-like oxidoreductase
MAAKHVIKQYRELQKLDKDNFIYFCLGVGCGSLPSKYAANSHCQNCLIHCGRHDTIVETLVELEELLDDSQARS